MSHALTWVLVASGVLLLVNSLFPRGFFPSGHGPGRVPEVILGAVLVVYGLVRLWPGSSKGTAGVSAKT